MGDLMYFCISFTFAYSMTMGYSGVYGIRETVLTRLASQVEGGGSPSEVAGHWTVSWCGAVMPKEA